MVIGLGIFSLICLGAAYFFRSYALVMYGGGILGVLCLLVTISEIIQGLRTSPH